MVNTATLEMPAVDAGQERSEDKARGLRDHYRAAAKLAAHQIGEAEGMGAGAGHLAILHEVRDNYAMLAESYAAEVEAVRSRNH